MLVIGMILTILGSLSSFIRELKSDQESGSLKNNVLAFIGFIIVMCGAALNYISSEKSEYLARLANDSLKIAEKKIELWRDSVGRLTSNNLALTEKMNNILLYNSKMQEQIYSEEIGNGEVKSEFNFKLYYDLQTALPINVNHKRAVTKKDKQLADIWIIGNELRSKEGNFNQILGEYADVITNNDLFTQIAFLKILKSFNQIQTYTRTYKFNFNSNKEINQSDYGLNTILSLQTPKTVNGNELFRNSKIKANFRNYISDLNVLMPNDANYEVLDNKESEPGNSFTSNYTLRIYKKEFYDLKVNVSFFGASLFTKGNYFSEVTAYDSLENTRSLWYTVKFTGKFNSDQFVTSPQVLHIKKWFQSCIGEIAKYNSDN
jgi:uncharacterized membrane protein